MLKNYFKIAWRNLWKNKVFSLINILGLSVGIAFTLLIGAYVWGELRVNSGLKDAGNQYIILSKWKDPNMGSDIASIAALPNALKINYPGLVKNYYHFDGITGNVSHNNMHFRESMQLGDTTLLTMYGFKLLYGDAKTAMNGPFSVVITGHIAMKYFGKTDVVGQTLSLENFNGGKHEFIISGVLQPLPKNSVTNLNAENNSNLFLPAGAAKFMGPTLDGWNDAEMVNYLELQKGANPKTVEKALLELVRKNAPEQFAKNLTPYLVPLKDYNLVAENGLVKKMTYTLSCIALFILLMAVVNFVNICIGRSSGRMKEMGIRKVLGGLRKQLIQQFLVESVLLVMLSTILALVIYLLARPYFGNLLGSDIKSLFAFPVYFIPLPFLLALFIGLLAGFYPALVLSAANSVDSLKGKLTSVKESVLFRKTLVAFQFATAAVVFIGAIIISQQIQLFFSSNLGYNKDYVVYAQLPRDWSPQGVQKMEAIQAQFEQMPSVKSISLSYDIPDGMNGLSLPVYKQGATPSQSVTAQVLNDDNRYAATYGIPLTAGTFFKPVYNGADFALVVINQTAAKALGFNNPEDAVGQKVMLSQLAPTPFTVCGVTADFHFGSMQSRIAPIIFTNVNYLTYYRYFSIRLKPGDMQQSLTGLQNKWVQLMPGEPFEYHFMDDALNKLYATELQLKKAVFVASFLTVVIVLLGVLGLISLSIQKRTKEIGIRKVLGSSVAGITQLFLKDFMGVVIIAGVIACPLAWLLMSKWLNDYAYRINISAAPFIVSLALLTAVTAVLIVLQTAKAAFSNPVKSLRSE